MQKQLLDFHRIIGTTIGDSPGIRDGKLRGDLIIEEAGETRTAIDVGDLVEAIDGMCDTIYVVFGAAVAFGIDLEPFFNEVHRTNMLKANGPIREDGKRLKPPGWKPPRIKEMLDEVMYAHDECGGRGEVQGETEMVLCYCDRGRRPDAPPRLAQGTDLTEIRQLLYFHKD